jgi:hypothetical protein
MIRYFFKQRLLPAFLSILFCCTAFTAKAGLDSYEIYLNNKLVLKQYVNEPLSLASLPLNQSNINDRLVINYSQCNAPGKVGKDRSILVKDATGKILKQWKFANASGGRASMVIAVKDLLVLDKKTSKNELSLYYEAEGRPEGQMLANFHIGSKATTYRSKQTIITDDIVLRASFPFIKSFCL